MNFKYQKEKLKTKYLNDLKGLNYWEDVSDKIKKHKEDNDIRFSMEFLHTDGLDDESKIESYADYYGYKIVDENLKSNKSIYYFERKE